MAKNMKLLIKTWLLRIEILDEDLAEIWIDSQEYFIVPKKELIKIEGTEYLVLKTEKADILIFNDQKSSARLVQTALLFKRIENYQTRLERGIKDEYNT
ncbi:MULTISPECIES: hypothetical protein [Terrabacteria group]|uniref:hypothetical protein n=1 Tax=Bacillati TaxID=1783272 RepID=UPI00193A533A|nr:MULTISPECIES: hypothetical protein [Terrabacteria group]MBW9213109.1 hypothetical protein [Trueperella sp. zg.1013]QRG86932.1 hypothetical protein JOS54_01035 [Bulleidia sp. zg-1006]